MSYLSVVDSKGNPIPTSMISGDYEAASTSRRMGDYGLSSSGPNTALSGPLHTLRSRTRTMIRNNPYASGAADGFVSNLVGTDISPHWELEDEDKNEFLQDLWADSQQELDFNEIHDFYGMTAQVARALPDAGEALARFLPQPYNSNLLVPLQIQLLEGDHLDASYNGMAPNGNEIRMGIEWNKKGKRAAYWLFTEHPGELHLGYHYSGDRVRVPASEVAHVFRPDRIGQARGCPWFTPSLTTLYELDQFEDATLVRKKVAALFSVFFTSSTDFNGTNPPSPNPAMPFGQQQTNDSKGNPVVALEPGLSARLNPGEDIKVADPADVGDNYLDFMKTGLRKVAKGFGPLTYEQVTGDLEGVNLSSIRYGIEEIRRMLETVQQHVIIHQWCRPVSRYWLKYAVLSGVAKIQARTYRRNFRKYWRITWQPDAWHYMDPVKDRLAEQMDVRNGVDSRKAIVGRRGRDNMRVDKEIAADNKRADKLKLIYDTDPRHTAKSGVMQKAEEKIAKESLDDE